MDEGLRTFKDGVVGTIRTIDAGGDKRVIEGNKGFDNEKRYKTNREILWILRSKIGEKAFSEWAIRGLWCISKEKILQCRMYEESILENWEQLESKLQKLSSDSTKYKQTNYDEITVRDLWENWKTECSSYGRELSEQQYRELDNFMSKLSYENSQREKCLQDLRKASEGIGVLQQALYEIQKVWKSSDSKQGTQSSYRIRKLTPIETWRLMGFTDEDFLTAKVGDRKIAKELIDIYEPAEHLKMMQEADKISKVSNTQLYKQAGNSIVVDVLYYIFKELYEVMPYLFDDLKVSSYFSGIGAFESALDRLYADINSGSVVAPTCMSSEPAGGENELSMMTTTAM